MSVSFRWRNERSSQVISTRIIIAFGNWPVLLYYPFFGRVRGFFILSTDVSDNYTISNRIRRLAVGVEPNDLKLYGTVKIFSEDRICNESKCCKKKTINIFKKR